MTLALYVVGGALVVLAGVLSLIQGWKWRRSARTARETPSAAQQPRNLSEHRLRQATAAGSDWNPDVYAIRRRINEIQKRNA